MSSNLLTAETRAELDEEGVLHIREPIRGLKAGEVRVIVISKPSNEEDLGDYENISAAVWNRAMNTASALAFLHDSEEDIYTLEDGKPYDWKAE